MELLLVPIGLFFLAAAVGRWWIVPVAAVGIGALAIFLVVNKGWHGNGWSDFGVAFNLIVAALSVAAAVGGLTIRRGLG